MSFIYYCLKALFSVVANIFFKEITILGLENIPLKGPVIICGNHTNQFVDAMLMFLCTPRFVSFIIAAVSYRRKGIGTIARLLRAIPAERPQDIAKKGTGVITEIKGTRIYGVGTKFLTEVKPGETIQVKNIPDDFVVKEVLSDTELIRKTESIFVYSGLSNPFRILPKLDHSQLYNKVWERLHNNDCVGIFPEGGSHDKTQMLPLKAGIGIMALGAMAKYNCTVTIVPCGLNYFKPYKFRSKVVIEFGTPYIVPQELANMYQTNRREAVDKLLHTVEKMMNQVIIHAPTYNELMAIHLSRKLYVPDNFTLTPQDEHLLSQRLGIGYNKLKDHPEVKRLFDEVSEYHQNLRKLKLEDSEIKGLSPNRAKNVGKFLISLFYFFITLSFALPGIIFNGPLALIIRFLSVKKMKKAGYGTDVLASHKVLISLVVFPIAWTVWTIGFRWLLSSWGWAKGDWLTFWTVLYFIGWPFYHYAMIKAIDMTIIQYKNVKARLILLLFKSKVRELQDTRMKLKADIQTFVERYAARVSDFELDEPSSTSEGSGSFIVDQRMDEAFGALGEMI